MNTIEIAEAIIGCTTAPPRRWAETWWEYDARRNCYRPTPTEEYQARLLKLLHDISPKRVDPKGADWGSCWWRDQVEEGLKSSCMVPGAARVPCWVEAPPSGIKRFACCKSLIAYPGGILDTDALIAEQSDCTLPSSPNYFCLSALDYPYDPSAESPRFEQFLAQITGGDAEVQKLLQEWFGYCLVPDVGFHKFLVMIGDGANGKSVLAQVLRGVVGGDNCTSLSMSQLCSTFGRAGLIGKLVNISDELSETEKANEELLKTIAAGQPVAIDRKYKSMIDGALPTRLVFTTNTLPHFRDRTDGIWRRMIVVPFRVQIEQGDQVRDLADKLLTERAGILNWALRGLKRLRQQGAFTSPPVTEQAREVHRLECNPIKEFLDEAVVGSVTDSRIPRVSNVRLIERYKEWAVANGRNEKFGGPAIGKELRKKYPAVTLTQVRLNGGVRARCYVGIGFVDEVERIEELSQKQSRPADESHRGESMSVEDILKKLRDDGQKGDA